MADGMGFAKRRLIERIVKSNWPVKNAEDKKFNFAELLYIIQEMTTEEGKEYFEGQSAQRGYGIFREFVKMLLYRNLANYDSMILLTADKGTGKSSAAIMIAREWCKLIGIQFNPERHIAYNNADVMNKIDKLNKFEPIVCVTGGSTIIIKKDGKVKSVKIKDLVDMKDYEVLSYNIKKDIFEYQKPSTGAVYTKKDITYTLELENGDKIEATKDHKILTKNGYKKLIDLTEDDEVVVNSKKCLVCGKEFHSRRYNKVCCSKQCSEKYLTRVHRIEYTRKKARERYKNKMKTDIEYRLKHNLHTRIMKYFKGYKTKGNDRTLELIGCTIKELKIHLEKQFKSGMSWENYGHDKNNWSMDHITPICTFNLNDKDEKQKCFHYTNIQPLWNNNNSAKTW